MKHQGCLSFLHWFALKPYKEKNPIANIPHHHSIHTYTYEPSSKMNQEPVSILVIILCWSITNCMPLERSILKVRIKSRMGRFMYNLEYEIIKDMVHPQAQSIVTQVKRLNGCCFLCPQNQSMIECFCLELSPWCWVEEADGDNVNSILLQLNNSVLTYRNMKLYTNSSTLS